MLDQISGSTIKLTNTYSTLLLDLSKKNTDTYLWPRGDIHCNWGHSLGWLCDHAGGSLISCWLGHRAFNPIVVKGVNKRISNTDRIRGIGKWLSYSLLTNYKHRGNQSTALCWAFRYKGYDYFLTPPHDLSHPMALQWLC